MTWVLLVVLWILAAIPLGALIGEELGARDRANVFYGDGDKWEEVQ